MKAILVYIVYVKYPSPQESSFLFMKFKNAPAVLLRPAGDYIRWGIDSPTDTDLLLATYKGGSHLISDIQMEEQS